METEGQGMGFNVYWGSTPPPAEFRVGDVVRLREMHYAWTSADPIRARSVEPLMTIPPGTEGVIKLCDWWPRILRDEGLGYAWFVVAIPEARCYTYARFGNLEFIEHQPSPEEIAAMYAEAT